MIKCFPLSTRKRSLHVAVQQRQWPGYFPLYVKTICVRSLEWDGDSSRSATPLAYQEEVSLELGHIFLTAVEGGFLVPSIFKTQSSFWTLIEKLQKPESWAHWRRGERRGKTTLSSFDFETRLRKAALLVVK